MTTDPLIGRQLDEYRLDKLLGRGGMARVYEAIDIRLQRKVAIKVIDAPYRENEEYGRRFEREARAIGQLEHPYVVRLYRYGVVDDLYYMAMQYVEGIDLSDYMAAEQKAGRPLRMTSILEIMTQICEALDYVHSKGVVHRDIKPSNILLNEKGEAILTDFGLALLNTTQTQGEVFGSPHYIAPEQAISSAGAVPQSDFYALGVILYEMVTGQLPFDGDSALAIAMMHTSDPPTPPRQIDAAISPALESMILRTLAKEPANRFANGQEFITALRQAFDQPEKVVSISELNQTESRPLPPVPAAVSTESVIQTAEAPTTQPDLQGKKRRRRRRVLLMLLLIIALVLGGGWLYQTDSAVRAEADRLLIDAGVLPPPIATPTAEGIAAVPPTEIATETITSTATAEPTVTPTPSATPSPTAEPTHTPTEDPTPTEETATEAADVSQPTATPTSEPTAAPSITPTPTPIPKIITRETDGMPMVRIPAGTFLMGASENDPFAQEDEFPAHEVTLADYYIDQYEISVGQYVTFLNEVVGFYQYESGCFGFPCLATQFEGFDSFVTDSNGQHVGQGESEDRPVNVIRWHGAAAYCEWVGGRLPTEAEWEYAAKGNTPQLYPWGDEPPDETRAVFGATDIGFRYTVQIEPIDGLPDGASPFDVYGMAGGVSEWVADAYAADFYANSPAENPANITDATAERYVVRGGAWNSPTEDLRTTARQPLSPLENDKAVGFRCAFDVAE